MHLAGRTHHLEEHAIDSEPNLERVLAGFDVNVGSTFLHCSLDDVVHVANYGGRIGFRLQFVTVVFILLDLDLVFPPQRQPEGRTC